MTAFPSSPAPSTTAPRTPPASTSRPDRCDVIAFEVVGTCLGTCCSAQMECRCDDGYENRTGECVLTDVCVNNNGGCHPRVCTCDTVLPSEHTRKNWRHTSTVHFRRDARQLHHSKKTARVQQKLSVTAGTSAPVTSCTNSNTHLLCRRFIGCCRCLVSRDLPGHP